MATHQARMFVERVIVSSTIRALLGAGYQIDVCDGEEDVLTRCSDHDEVIKHMFTTDEDYIYGVKDGKRRGWVRFIYGNSGYDVMNDCTTNLETVLQPVNELANKFDGDPLGALEWLLTESDLAKDAQRYRWIREHHNDPASDIAVTGGGEDVMLEDVAGLPYTNTGPSMDLDAALTVLMAPKCAQPS
jgi:hypothetical protein